MEDNHFQTIDWERYDIFSVIFDSVNVPFIFLNIILCSLCVYYALNSTPNFVSARKLVVNVISAMMLINVIFTTLNLGVFYVAFELLIVPMFFLIGSGTKPRRLYAVMLFLIYTITFSYVMLFGLIYT